MPDNPHTSVGINLGRYMTSEVFELTSADGVSFFVTKDILTSHSQPFRDATVEPTDRKIHLPHWDSDTVARLVEFLFIGDYTYPDPSPLQPCLTLPQAPAPADPPSSPPDPDRPTTPPAEWLNVPPSPEYDRALTDAERLAQFVSADHDFSDVLLAHAKVYALGSEKGISRLCALACRRLHLVLAWLNPLTPGSRVTADIVDLGIYVYGHTVRPEDPLRKLASRFIALNLGVFQSDQRAVELMREGGDFVQDLFANVCMLLPGPSGNPGPAGCPAEGYISSLQVMYPSQVDGPEGHVIALNGLSAMITWPNYAYLWIVPAYTQVVEEACTGFTISTSAEYPGDYIKTVKDTAVAQKITEVALMRTATADGLDLQTIKEFDGMSPNLAMMTTSGQLYLLWKTTA